MFQVGMSRPLIIAAVFMVTLAGCVAQPNTPTETPDHAQACACTQLQNLLVLQHKVATMDIEEIKKQLSGLAQPKGPQQLFYFGLLNQQLDAFAAWTAKGK